MTPKPMLVMIQLPFKSLCCGNQEVQCWEKKDISIVLALWEQALGIYRL